MAPGIPVPDRLESFIQLHARRTTMTILFVHATIRSTLKHTVQPNCLTAAQCTAYNCPSQKDDCSLAIRYIIIRTRMKRVRFQVQKREYSAAILQVFCNYIPSTKQLPLGHRKVVGQKDDGSLAIIIRTRMKLVEQKRSGNTEVL